MNPRKHLAALPFTGLALVLSVSACGLGTPEAKAYTGIKPLVVALNEGGFHCPLQPDAVAPQMTSSMFGVTGMNECKDNSGRSVAGVLTYPEGKSSAPIVDLVFAAALAKAPQGETNQARKIDGVNWDIVTMTPEAAREVQAIVGGEISEFDPPKQPAGVNPFSGLGFGAQQATPSKPIELSLGQDTAATVDGVTANVTVEGYYTGGSSNPAFDGTEPYPASFVEVTICPMTAQPVHLINYEQGFELRTDDGRTAVSYGFFADAYTGYPSDILPIDAGGVVQQGSCANGLLVFDDPLESPDTIALTGTMGSSDVALWSLNEDQPSASPAPASNVPGDVDGNGARDFDEGGPRPNVTCEEANVPGCATKAEENAAQQQENTEQSETTKSTEPATGESVPSFEECMQQARESADGMPSDVCVEAYKHRVN